MLAFQIEGLQSPIPQLGVQEPGLVQSQLGFISEDLLRRDGTHLFFPLKGL